MQQLFNGRELKQFTAFLLAIQMLIALNGSFDLLHLIMNIGNAPKGSIGKRYARMDEAGTPFCITVDKAGHDYLRQMCDESRYMVIEDIAAFYSVQQSRPAESGQTLVQDLTDKCNRCHGPEVAENPNVVFPKINGQDRDYLIMALRAYRDDRRKSSMMHTMSMPYGDAVIESLADYYSSQPVK